MNPAKDEVGQQARATQHGGEPLAEYVRRAIEGYFTQIGDHETSDLYQLVLGEVERPLFECTLKHCGGNQTRTARTLGLNRGTLRKKLQQYGIE